MHLTFGHEFGKCRLIYTAHTRRQLVSSVEKQRRWSTDAMINVAQRSLIRMTSNYLFKSLDSVFPAAAATTAISHLSSQSRCPGVASLARALASQPHAPIHSVYLSVSHERW